MTYGVVITKQGMPMPFIAHTASPKRSDEMNRKWLAAIGAAWDQVFPVHTTGTPKGLMLVHEPRRNCEYHVNTSALLNQPPAITAPQIETENGIGQHTTSVEKHFNRWFIITRDSYRKITRTSEGYPTRKKASAVRADYCDYFAR